MASLLGNGSHYSYMRMYMCTYTSRACQYSRSIPEVRSKKVVVVGGGASAWSWRGCRHELLLRSRPSAVAQTSTEMALPPHIQPTALEAAPRRRVPFAASRTASLFSTDSSVHSAQREARGPGQCCPLWPVGEPLWRWCFGAFGKEWGCAAAWPTFGAANGASSGICGTPFPVARSTCPLLIACPMWAGISFDMPAAMAGLMPGGRSFVGISSPSGLRPVEL